MEFSLFANRSRAPAQGLLFAPFLILSDTDVTDLKQQVIVEVPSSYHGRMIVIHEEPHRVEYAL